jgi:hypothetical protein
MWIERMRSLVGFWVRDLRIKFYAKWKEFIKEQAVDPDQPRYLTRFVYPILVPAGPGWVRL